MVADDVDAVGVLRRDEHDDRVRQHLPRFRRLRPRQPLGQEQRGEDASDFGGVNARGDQHHELSVGDQAVALSGSSKARVHELPLDLLIPRQIRQRCRVGDERDDEGPA
jgi:hypothetical protein